MKYEALIVEAGLLSLHFFCCDQRPMCPVCDMISEEIVETYPEDVQKMMIQHVINKVTQHGCLEAFLRRLDNIDLMENER